MKRCSFVIILCFVYSLLSAQSSDSAFRLQPDSLSKEAGEFRKTIHSGNLPLVLSEEEKAWMDEILFYEQDSNPSYITTPIPRQTITYNSYDRPVSISQDGITATLTYNGAGDRVKMTVVDSTASVPATLLTRYYIGGRYEVDSTSTTTTERFYLGGDAYSAPMVLVRTGGSGSWTAYNIGRDHLGSITLITTASGTPVAEYSYDPWGRMRNPADLTIYNVGNEPSLFLGRGYTGHEFLPWFSLYDMNARLYDPLVGRFLSPDPYVQAPDFTQNFNRYSYCLNNPLKYSDEDGEFIITTAVIVGLSISTALGIGAGIWQGVKIADAKGLSGAARTWTIIGGGLLGGVAGFASGYVGAAVGAAATAGGFLGGTAAGAAAGATGGAINGFGQTMLATGNLGQSLNQMVFQGVAGAFSGALIGGVVQGVSSAIKGNNFWTGLNPRYTATPNHPSLKDTKVNIDNECIDSPVSDIPDEYRIRAKAAEVFSFNQSDLRPQLSVQRPDIIGYDPRLANQTDIYHNFPRLFDDIIVKSGVPNYRISDNSMFYYLTGSVNGKEGVFTIGINNDGIIYHRFFYPK